MMPKQVPAYKVTANDFEFMYTNEEAAAADMIEISPGIFNIIVDGRSVNVKLLATDDTLKQMTLEVEGQKFDIGIKEPLDQLLEQMGFGVGSQTKIKEINAPMPGLVLDILVSEGQQVDAGDAVLVLQAMKMENSIGVHGSATIKKILVKKGQAVEKGQRLVDLD